MSWGLPLELIHVIHMSRTLKANLDGVGNSKSSALFVSLPHQKKNEKGTDAIDA